MREMWLDFELPIKEIEEKIENIEARLHEEDKEGREELERLKKEREKLFHQIYSNLTPWQRVQVARHPNRPTAKDYIKLILDDFFELHGDGYFGDDPAVITGLGTIGGKKVIFIGQVKGGTTKEKIYHNFGMLHPEGYRKALRVMKLGEKFTKPIVVLIDTPGAYPGIGAEERGQAQAIARNIMEMSGLKTSIIVIIIGEGGSGGALGIGVGDVVLMQEYAFYSVISPEGCASILWKDSTQVEKAAKYLHITPQDLLKLKVIDEIIKEPIGGAHRNPREAGEEMKRVILKYLNHLSQENVESLVKKRQKKFESLGIFLE